MARIHPLLIAAALAACTVKEAGSSCDNTNVLRTKNAPTKNQQKAKRRKDRK